FLKLRVSISAALPFDLFCKVVRRAIVLRIALGGLAPRGDRLRRMPATTLEHAQQIVDAIVVWRERPGTLEPLRRRVQISLPERQPSPVRPTCWFTRNNLGHLRQFRICMYIVTHL